MPPKTEEDSSEFRRVLRYSHGGSFVKLGPQHAHHHWCGQCDSLELKGLIWSLGIELVTWYHLVLIGTQGDRRYGPCEVGVRFARSLPGGVVDSCVILCHAFVWWYLGCVQRWLLTRKSGNASLQRCKWHLTSLMWTRISFVPMVEIFMVDVLTDGSWWCLMLVEPVSWEDGLPLQFHCSAGTGWDMMRWESGKPIWSTERTFAPQKLSQTIVQRCAEHRIKSSNP